MKGPPCFKPTSCYRDAYSDFSPHLFSPLPYEFKGQVLLLEHFWGSISTSNTLICRAVLLLGRGWIPRAEHTFVLCNRQHPRSSWWLTNFHHLALMKGTFINLIIAASSISASKNKSLEQGEIFQILFFYFFLIMLKLANNMLRHNGKLSFIK